MYSVLYVDDEPGLLEIGKIFLEDDGEFSVETITSARDALALLNTKTFDAIVSDYQMPGMDGIQFLIEVRNRFGRIPFILFTGRGREEVVIQAINSGVDFYLQKGGDPSAQFAELAHKIKQAASRKKAEDSLKKTEDDYRFLAEHSNGAIVIVQDGKVRLANQRAIEQSGYPEEELLSMPFQDIIHPDDRSRVMERYQKRMKGEEAPSQYAFRTRRKDGSTIWVEISAVTIVWEGRPATLNFLIDITERIRVAEELKLSQSRLESAMEAGAIAWWEMDCITGNVIFNERKVRMMGYTAEQFSHYTDFTRLVHPDDYEPMMQDMRDHLSGITKQYAVDYRIRAQSGEYVWFHDVGGISGYAPDGKPLKVVGLVIDITGRKQAEEAIIDAKDYLNRILNSIADPVFVKDEKHRRVLVNEAYCSFTGFTRDELINKSDHDLYSRDLADHLNREDDMVFATGEGRVAEEQITDHRGKVHTVVIKISLLVDRQGNRFVVGIARDISDRIRM
jgi:PAS domain S-box-containing protein